MIDLVCIYIFLRYFKRGSCRVYSFAYCQVVHRRIFLRLLFLNSAYFSASEHTFKPFGLNNMNKHIAGSRANTIHAKCFCCYILLLYIYMNLNATKCTFGHSDITSRKQQKAKKLCNMRYGNNAAFVIFEHWATK